MKICLSLLLLLVWGPLQAGIRDHTRPNHERTTEVSEAQGVLISLTLATVARQQLQRWVRAAAQVDESGTQLLGRYCLNDADSVAVGQRVIAFVPDAKSQTTQAWVSRIEPRQECVMIEAELTGSDHTAGARYVMEIIIPRGRRLAVPKEAVIEVMGQSLVYVQHHGGHYMPRTIHTGLKGERYTEVLHGLVVGEAVVTLGSFFIHAQHQLGEETSGGGHAHHAH